MEDLASKEKRAVVDREESRNPSSVADTLEESSVSRETQMDESFGTVSKIRANSTGGGLATRSRREETKKDVGLSPEKDSTRNSGGVESTIFLTRSRTTSYGKEEEELNRIIRRMIIMELNRYRKREQTMLKRAHSDTESVLARKRHNDGSRTDPFGGEGHTFSRDLTELEESLRKRVEIDETTTSTCCNVDSDIRLERKVNASCLRDAEAERSIAPKRVLTTDRQRQANKSTQTKHVYVIRAVRSCPLRKRRLPTHLQPHRLASGRDAVCSKTVYASPDHSTFVFRKASDNLIYEKGKASRSPSYIPNPERHRWRYITPRKTK
ncbi:hypothetical protein K0M31_005902 [Melipona bicolor]|uniref:Uncharacterized protein n=1 Tax=Melipona bicolor TaxID=60889 RepID=A0AA40FUB7_9HYME|nr:hypothetical protein K0M31_005902 [Melipona bicolor]